MKSKAHGDSLLNYKTFVKGILPVWRRQRDIDSLKKENLNTSLPKEGQKP
jgi:hypothetical protein